MVLVETSKDAIPVLWVATAIPFAEFSHVLMAVNLEALGHIAPTC
jgi:hypothetical protein